jgi:hypothetical protein
MKTNSFKHFLKEEHYGSLIDQDLYRGLDTADKALYKYTADGFTSLGGVIDKLIKKYGYEGGALYRGLHFSNEKEHDAFLEKIAEGNLEVGSPTSWTPSKDTAYDFAQSKKSYFPTPELMYASEHQRNTGDHMSGYGGVVLVTKVGSGVGVDVSQSEFAKESEVILKGGTYKVKIEELLEPHSRKYDTSEKVDAIIQKLKKAKERTPELNKFAEYVSKSWMKKLAPEQVDVLVKYEVSKFLKASPQEVRENSIRFEIDKDLFSDNEFKLRLHVYAGAVNDDVYDMCSDAMRAILDKRCKLVVGVLKDVVKKIVAHPNVDDISAFDISGVNYLKRYFPSEVEAAVLPIRKMLGKKYHELNSRETSKKLTDMDSINKHMRKVEAIVGAMSKF